MCFLLKKGKLTQCSFTQICLFVQTWKLYMSICLYNNAGGKMHNNPVKTMGLDPAHK